MNYVRFARKLLLPALLGCTTLAVISASAEAGAPLQASCKLHSEGNKIKRVVYLQFDNVHLRRDNPNVPSDLEQMPHLLNFLLDNGTVSGNHWDPLISHTSHDIVTTMSGVYGERFGWSVGNSFGFFRDDGSVGFQSSFVYWTAQAADGHPEMANEVGKIAPAPWVPYTRAGCDVGAFSIADIEFESVPNDVTTVFGAGSPQDTSVRALLANPRGSALNTQASTDWLGIAIHCAKGSALCKNGAPDLLPDEPGGYEGFNALFGNINVQPAISPNGPVKDMDGNVIADKFGHPGFPNSFDPLATQTLGYAATMLEAGVPVVYLYISDVHDNEVGSALSIAQTFGPGEAPYVAQLKLYDAAFEKFFERLAADGITKENTLFVVTADENDHFVGGPPSPANCDGIKTPCTYDKKGEVDAFIDRLLLSQRQNTTPFLVHSDDAPTVYINGNPAPTAPVTRTLEQDMNALTVISPISGRQEHISALLGDQAVMKLLHMVSSVPDRTPSFVLFGNDDYFIETSTSSSGEFTDCSERPACLAEDAGFAWNHGDFQTEITRTWFGIVGPGVKRQGRNDDVFSDHTDLRPTMMTLVGLKDDYVHDGRVLVEKLDPNVLPGSLKGDLSDYVALAQAYKQINATKGSVGVNALVYANQAITADDKTYGKYLTTIGAITDERNDLASQMIALLNGAAFENAPIHGENGNHGKGGDGHNGQGDQGHNGRGDQGNSGKDNGNDTVSSLVSRANQLVRKVEGLAEHGH